MRQLKQTMGDWLVMEEESRCMARILGLPAQQAANALFYYIQDTRPEVKWRAVRAMGMVVAVMARDNREASRVVMRRLMWSLNDESGGIGWGAPEAMGEIMAQDRTLAVEYRNILKSYVNPQGNYLEFAPLRKGAQWALDRVNTVHPDVMAG